MQAGGITRILAVLAMDYWCVVPEQMLVTVSTDPHEMSWSAVVVAVAALCGMLNLEDLLRPFLLMWLFKGLQAP